MSNHSRVDPERLAALMEGQLGERDAAEVRAALAASDAELVAAFADASAVATELGLTAAASRRKGGRTLYSWIPIVTLAAAASVFFIVRSRGNRDESFNAGALVAQLPSSIAAPAANPWPATRGADDERAPSVRAARLGAALVDLQLAMRSADAAAVRRSAATIVALADALPGASPLLAPYQVLASGGTVADSAERSLNEAEAALTSLAGSAAVGAGAAGEVVRAVATSGDSAAVEALCGRAAELGRHVQKSGVATGDSLITALNERPCSAGRLEDVASRFLTSVTR